MNRRSYSELLKDPRWQRRRLEVLAKHGFKCQECGDDTSPLHVHHVVYIRNRKPWEYEDNLLKCYCEDCHEFAEIVRQDIAILLSQMPLQYSGDLQAALTDILNSGMEQELLDWWMLAPRQKLKEVDAVTV